MPFRPNESGAMFSVMSFNEPNFDPAVRSHASADFEIEANLSLDEIDEEVEGKVEHRAISVDDLEPPPLAYLSSPESSPDGPEFLRRVVKAGANSNKGSPATASSKPSRTRQREDLYKSSRRKSSKTLRKGGVDGEKGSGSNGRRRSLNNASSSSPYQQHRSTRRTSYPNQALNSSEVDTAENTATAHYTDSGHRLSTASSSDSPSRRNVLVSSGLPGVYSSNHGTSSSPGRHRPSASSRMLRTQEHDNEDVLGEEGGTISPPQRSNRSRQAPRTTRAASRRNLWAAAAPPPPSPPASNNFRSPSPKTYQNHRKSLGRSNSEDIELLNSAGSASSRRHVLGATAKDTPAYGSQQRHERNYLERSASDGAAVASSRPAPSRRQLMQQQRKQTSSPGKSSSNRHLSDANRSRSPSHSRRANSCNNEEEHRQHRRSRSAERNSDKKVERSQSTDRKSGSTKGTRSRSKSRDRKPSSDADEKKNSIRRGRRPTNERNSRSRSKSRDACAKRHTLRSSTMLKYNSNNTSKRVLSGETGTLYTEKASPSLIHASNDHEQEKYQHAAARASPHHESSASPRGLSGASPGPRYVLSQQSRKDRKQESKERRSNIMKSLKDLLLQESDQDNLKLEVQKDGTKRLVVELSDLHSVMEDFASYK